MSKPINHLWQCMLYDTLTDYPYADSRVYRTKEDAEKRAKRMTYWEDDYVQHWATVHSVNACWQLDKLETEDAKAENEKLRLLVRGLDYCLSRRKFVSCERCPLYDVTDVNIEPKCDLMMRELGIEVE